MAKGIEMARVRVVLKFQRKRSKTRNAIAPPQNAVSRRRSTESRISLEVSQTLIMFTSGGKMALIFSKSLITVSTTRTVFAPDSLVTHIMTASFIFALA